MHILRIGIISPRFGFRWSCGDGEFLVLSRQLSNRQVDRATKAGASSSFWTSDAAMVLQGCMRVAPVGDNFGNSSQNVAKILSKFGNMLPVFGAICNDFWWQ